MTEPFIRARPGIDPHGRGRHELAAFPALVALVLGVRALGLLMALRFGLASGAAFIPVAGLALALSPVPGPVGRPVTRVFSRHYLEA